MARSGHSGTGPGPVTPDGSPVGLYRRLTARGEDAVVAGQLAPGASILELGCGAGRITRPLVERGFAVTAVDESAEMLALVRGARTVCAPIETLDLGQRFDAVLLMSFLVHAADEDVRRGLLGACRRHVADSGVVLLQREGEDHHTAVPREAPLDEGVSRVLAAEPVGGGVHRVTVEYDLPYGRWTQTFLSRSLTDAQFEAALAEAGLAVDAYLTGDRIWVRAVARRAG